MVLVHTALLHRPMNADLRKLIAARPFAPFTIHLADGGSVHVPTVDHIHVFPDGGRAIVHKDNGDYEILSGLLMPRITVESPPAQTAEGPSTSNP